MRPVLCNGLHTFGAAAAAAAWAVAPARALGAGASAAQAVVVGLPTRATLIAASLPGAPTPGPRRSVSVMSGGAARVKRGGPAAAHMPLLQPPADLKLATTPAELAALLPSTYPIARFRRRSVEARGVRVSYKPRPGEALGDGGAAAAAAAGANGDPPPRTPSDSYLEVVLPFATSPDLRDEYERFRMGRVRLGLVLEDIDSFAADVAARHLAGAVQGFSIVTASMDKLQLVSHEQHVQQLRRRGACGGSEAGSAPTSNIGLDAEGPFGGAPDADSPPAALLTAPLDEPPPLDAEGRAQLQRAVVEAPPGSDQASGGPLLVDNDLRLAGCVAWVGRSSLEVVIELADRPPQPAADGTAGPGGWRRRGVAIFVLVARGADPGHPVRVNPLAPATAEEEVLCAAAAERQEQRRLRRVAEAEAAQPDAAVSGADGVLLQQLMARARQHRAEQWQQSHGGAAAAAERGGCDDGCGGLPAVPMGSTSLQVPVIMHHQDRNITNAIFGGHILRSAYEAAYATAALHAGAHPEPLSMSDITFKQPVTVGSIVEFDSKVVLTHGDLMRVSVQAIKHEPAATPGGPGRVHQALTTTFSFLFAAPPGTAVPPVRPDSLADAADWLLAARQHRSDGYEEPPIAAWGDPLRARA